MVIKKIHFKVYESFNDQKTSKKVFGIIFLKFIFPTHRSSLSYLGKLTCSRNSEDSL